MRELRCEYTYAIYRIGKSTLNTQRQSICTIGLIVLSPRLASPHLAVDEIAKENPNISPGPLPHAGDDARDDVNCVHATCLYPGHPLVHFDVPTAAGRQIFSVQCCGRREVTVSPPFGSSRPDQLAGARPGSGPVIVVFLGRDGEYFTDYGFSGLQRQGIDQLMHHVLSPLPRLDDKHASSAQTLLQQADVSSQTGVLDTATLEESSAASTNSSSYAQGTTIRVRIFNDWGITFYTRIDHRGIFHTYPHVGGQFHSLPEAYAAIDCYLRDREDPTMRIDPHDPDLILHVHESTRERAIRRILCWPDGTRKSRLRSLPIDERRCKMLQLVRSLVGKYNDDHNLLGDLAYELKDVVCYHVFNEGNGRRMYYHVNFTAMTKDSGDLLFFAETMYEKRVEMVVSCICRVNPFDRDMGYCYACQSDVKHPKGDLYAGGHSSVGCLSSTYHFNGPREEGVTFAELQAEESRVRHSYKEPRDPNFLERLRTPIKVNFPPPRPADRRIHCLPQ